MCQTLERLFDQKLQTLPSDVSLFHCLIKFTYISQECEILPGQKVKKVGAKSNAAKKTKTAGK